MYTITRTFISQKQLESTLSRPEYLFFKFKDFPGFPGPSVRTLIRVLGAAAQRRLSWAEP